LDVEERVQRCLSDARQYLEVRPEMAWSRAQQAVTLLGRSGAPGAVSDRAARDAALLTVSEICYVLAMRGVRLPPELGSPDLFNEACDQARAAQRERLSYLIRNIAEMAHGVLPSARFIILSDVAIGIVSARAELEPWVVLELDRRWKGWLDELEAGMANNPSNTRMLVGVLPAVCRILNLPDADVRAERIYQRSVQIFVKDRKYDEALQVLPLLPERQPRTEAVCHEGLGNFREAAECFVLAGSKKDALRCYRLIPDIPKALELAREVADDATAESLEWIGKLRELVDQRPEKFTKVVSPAEKKILEQLLEQALGVTRQKPAAKKAAGAKKAAAAKKAPAAKKAAAPKPRAPKKRPYIADDDFPF
jgi:hypothetical protein